MKNKNNILKFAFTLFTIVCVLYVIQTYLELKLKSIKSGTIGKINAIMDHEIDDEVMIWGASTANVNFNSKLISKSLHLSVMNMGLDGTNLDQFSGLLYEFLSYTKKCKTIVLAFDINSGLVERNQFYQTSMWVQHLENGNIRKTFNEIDPDLLDNPLPFSNLTLYDKHVLKYIKNSPFSFENKHDFPNKGYSPLKPTHCLPLEHSKKRLPVGKRILKKIDLICKMALSKKINPIIVITPCYQKGQASIKNKTEIISAIMQFNSSNVTVLDLHNLDLSKDVTKFNDNVHMNWIGSKEFSKIVAEKLIQLK